MPDTQELYSSYTEKLQRIADVKNASALLQWDQETYLPAGSAHFRGQQLTTLADIAHGLFSEDSLGDLLSQLESKKDLSAEQARNVALSREDYLKNKKYSSTFVRKLSDATNNAFHSWMEARKQNSFSPFRDHLQTMIDLKKQEAEILGYEHHPYNALLNEYEKGATVALVDKTFTDLLPSLKPLLEKIRTAVPVDDSFLQQSFPKQQQWDWGMYLIRQLNFDFDRGRQDLSEHPFSVSFSPDDVRITTRVDEADFSNMTWSSIHETGHALYEQGLPSSQYGLPLGEACSYSIHESQSRLWENNVGRSKGFWDHHYPKLQEHFPKQFASVSGNDFYKAINKVQPSLIRTEADEITYHFHVYIRYELEKALLDGSLAARDIPEYWNAQYQQNLGVTVTDDKSGCIQDVHWSHGSFGYFPTYSLGSFYGAQLYAAATEQIAGLEKNIASGDSAGLLEWLRVNIHSKGRFFTSEELCREVTGKTLDVSYFINYLLHKYSRIYNL